MEKKENLLIMMVSPSGRLRKYQDLPYKALNVWVYNSIQEMEQVLAQQKVDAIIADLDPEPELGKEILKKINKDYPHTPAVAITEEADYDNVLLAMKAGAKDVLIEPFTRSKLMDTLLSVIQEAASKHYSQTTMMAALLHDLSNSLHAINGTARQIVKVSKDCEEKGEMNDLLNKMEDISKRASKMLYDSFSELELAYRQDELRTRVISLHSMTCDIENELEPQFEEKTVQFSNEVPKDCLVHAEPFMVRFVLLNLIHNAVKYARASGGRIEVNAFEHEQRVYVTVWDDGIGLDEKTLHAIKNDLAVTPQAGTDDEKGNGYGLLITKDFIRKHGSELQIISEEKRGSCFYFFLPAYDPAEKFLKAVSKI